MTNKIHSPSGASHSQDSVFYMPYCPSVHVLTGIAYIANTLYITKMLDNSTISKVTDVME